MMKMLFIFLCLFFVACSKGGGPSQAYTPKRDNDFRDEVIDLLKKEKYEVVYSMLKTKTLNNQDYELHIYFAVALLRLGFMEKSFEVFEKSKRISAPQKGENLLYYEELLSEYF